MFLSTIYILYLMGIKHLIILVVNLLQIEGAS